MCSLLQILNRVASPTLRSVPVNPLPDPTPGNRKSETANLPPVQPRLL